MVAQGRDTLEMVIGTVMTQSAILDFLIKKGVIEREPLMEHLVARRVVWEKTASPSALFAVDVLASILAGRQPPKPPGTLN